MFCWQTSVNRQSLWVLFSTEIEKNSECQVIPKLPIYVVSTYSQRRKLYSQRRKKLTVLLCTDKWPHNVALVRADGQTDRQTDRQTNRQTNIFAKNCKFWQVTNRQTNILAKNCKFWQVMSMSIAVGCRILVWVWAQVVNKPLPLTKEAHGASFTNIVCVRVGCNYSFRP